MARKAKRWDEKHMSQLKQQKVHFSLCVIISRLLFLFCFLFKEKLTEELREAMKKSRKESELNTVDSQIRGLETRLKYAKTDMESTVCIYLFCVLWHVHKILFLLFCCRRNK